MRMQKETMENDTGSSSFHLYSDSHTNMQIAVGCVTIRTGKKTLFFVTFPLQTLWFQMAKFKSYRGSVLQQHIP